VYWKYSIKLLITKSTDVALSLMYITLNSGGSVTSTMGLVFVLVSMFDILYPHLNQWGLDPIGIYTEITIDKK
jgi:hypothetical protein